MISVSEMMHAAFVLISHTGRPARSSLLSTRANQLIPPELSRRGGGQREVQNKVTAVPITRKLSTKRAAVLSVRHLRHLQSLGFCFPQQLVHAAHEPRCTPDIAVDERMMMSDGETQKAREKRRDMIASAHT
jgi:hypothetical protein